MAIGHGFILNALDSSPSSAPKTSHSLSLSFRSLFCLVGIVGKTK